MAINSKRKGKDGELELANILKSKGYDCRRTAQYCGNVEDAADLVGLDFIHIECKRVEKLNIDEAMEQARRDAKEKLPAVFHRKNKKPWKVTMGLEDWLKLYEKYREVMNERENIK